MIHKFHQAKSNIYRQFVRCYQNKFFYDDLEISLKKDLKPLPRNEDLAFGKQFSDHMFEVEWSAKHGWGKPRICPLHNLQLHPACSALHYAIQCFEGMKAFKSAKGDLLMFRPLDNMIRLNNSSARVALPRFDEKELLKCTAKLIDIEKRWVPDESGYSIYVRPTAISYDDTLGVSPPQKALLYVILSPVGPYFPTGFEPIKLYTTEKYVRAFPSGTGAFKIGANYGPTIVPQVEAMSKGYSQVLWTYGEDDGIEEVGTMNVLCHWINEEGVEELVTAPLSNGTILPGITRMSTLDICRKWGYNVQEKNFSLKQLLKAEKEGRILEVFGVGTACKTQAIDTIFYKGHDIKIPLPEDSLSRRLFDELTKIQEGAVESPYSIRVEDILNDEL